MAQTVTPGNTTMSACAAVFLACVIGGLALKASVDKPFTKRPAIADDLEVRLTVALRIELSKERARRVYPDLDEPGSPHARRMVALYAKWQEDNDERLQDPDFPFLLAREAAIPSL